ncbi:acyltransferase [Chloroflexia bacterium SDU3-3]|nr:acyltransferase [Chloroflexia bacterium SDU3-3]
MKSSSGAHYVALDHIRAIALFMVFCWHFLHFGQSGYPIPHSYTPAVFPLALLDEGHTGVALFMTLSGYLFTKLLDGKNIDYRLFLRNRALRLFPLLIIIIIVNGCISLAARKDPVAYIFSMISGLISPVWPNGGWSITAELHFYIILPFILKLARSSKARLTGIIVAAVIVRLLLYRVLGEIQYLSYWTIIGRIDQFTLGIIGYYARGLFKKKHLLFMASSLLFMLFYWFFDRYGGYYQSQSIWIFMPTIEGVAYAIFIAWYDTSFQLSNTGLSKVIGKVGELSYSIYLIHYFFVFKLAKFINDHIVQLDNFYIACLAAFFGLILMLPLGYLSYRCIEQPFLKFRKKYTLPLPATP